MVEQKVAVNLVKRALDDFNKTNNAPFPFLSISKRYYKRYNFDILNNELNRLNFRCVEKINAPEPFKNEKDSKKFYFVYQPLKK